MRRDRGYCTVESGWRFEPIAKSSCSRRATSRNSGIEAGSRSRSCVDERDPVAVRGQSPGLDRVALAEVAVVVDDPYVPVASTLQQTLGGAVDRAVRDDDQLDLLAGEPSGNSAPDHVDVLDDVVAAVVDRHDDRQRGAGTISPRSGNGDRGTRRRAGNSHRHDCRRRGHRAQPAGRQGLILSWRLAARFAVHSRPILAPFMDEPSPRNTRDVLCRRVRRVRRRYSTLPEVSDVQCSPFTTRTRTAASWATSKVRARQAILGRAWHSP